MAPTRKTNPRAQSAKAEPAEESVEAGSTDVDELLSRVVARQGAASASRTASASQASESAVAEPAAAEPAAADPAAADPSAADSTEAESATAEPATETDEVAAEPAVAEQEAASVPDVAPLLDPLPSQPLTETQLLNDPLLGTHDDIIADLGIKLRWAAVGYALLGAVASWIIAAQIAIATKSAGPFGWAIAATILIFAAGVWYFADVSSRFASVAAYRKAKTPQSIARLNRGGVVGLYGVVGAWIGAALGILVLVSGVTTAVLTIALGATGWTWFFGGIPVVLLYLFGFALLHYRLIEKARDAVA